MKCPIQKTYTVNHYHYSSQLLVIIVVLVWKVYTRTCRLSLAAYAKMNNIYDHERPHSRRGVGVRTLEREREAHDAWQSNGMP